MHSAHVVMAGIKVYMCITKLIHHQPFTYIINIHIYHRHSRIYTRFIFLQTIYQDMLERSESLKLSPLFPVSLAVRICVCMYLCMYVHMYICIYVCICWSVLSRSSSRHVSCITCGKRLHMYVRMYVCMYVCTYICMHVRWSFPIHGNPRLKRPAFGNQVKKRK